MAQEYTYTVRYWLDKGWLVGQIMEVPGCVSQGRTGPELLENLADAMRLIETKA
jgi:predicted RNase H-like HicB family nuclease